MDYTNGVYYVHALAIREASALGHEYVEAAHELLGICGLAQQGLGSCFAPGNWDEAALSAEAESLRRFFGRLGLDVALLRDALKRRMGRGDAEPKPMRLFHRSEECKRIFARAVELAGDESPANCLHLLAATMENPAPVIDGACRDVGNDSREVFLRLAGMLRSGEEALGSGRSERMSLEYLERFGIDLTGKVDAPDEVEIVDRRNELLQLERALLNPRKNPALVGEVGVGKDTLVRAMASRIARREVPAELREARIFKLAVHNLLRGEEIRPGRLLERLMRMVVEARGNRRVFLYLDDVNLLTGGGLAINRDVANVLLPAVMNNEVRCILATDTEGYSRNISGNPRLSGLFNKIAVEEPGEDVVLEILRRTRKSLEEEYPVRITEDALLMATRLSGCLDTGVALPEKAIDLLHEACAVVRLPTLSSKHKVDTLFATRWELPAMNDVSRLTVDGETVKEVVAGRTGLPSEVVARQASPGEGLRLEGLEDFLRSRIVGQDHALESICSRIISSYAGLSERKGPLSVFLFLGPTGVGKTETARLLAEKLFGAQDFLLRIDMSEYMESHAVAKLIGSPPGYVGYEEEGALTGWLRSRPHSVVLLDEIEKAHPKVFDLFLQVFDGGRITDAKGRTSDARNAVFVMTSNLVVLREGEKESQLEEEVVRLRLERHFRREFLNRIDRVVLYRRLDLEDVKRMIESILADLEANLAAKYGLELRMDEEVLDLLARRGYDPRYGARELRRTVQRLLEEPLSRKLMGSEFVNHKACRLSVRGEELEIRPEAR